jgi:hypothetical protein
MLGSWREHSTAKEQIKNDKKHHPQPAAGVWVVVPVARICLKKLQPDGCFECGKMITVRRFFELEPHSC